MATLALRDVLAKAPEDFGLHSPTSKSSSGSSNGGKSQPGSPYIDLDGFQQPRARGQFQAPIALVNMASNSNSDSNRCDSGYGQLPEPWETDPCVAALRVICPHQQCAQQFETYEHLAQHFATSGCLPNTKNAV